MKIKQKNKAILCIILAALCFTFMNAFVRLAGELPFVQKSFFRNFIALIFAGTIMLRTHTRLSCKPESRVFLFLRAACGTVGLLCNFYAVDHLVLADASMLNKMSPFFAVLFSALFIREKTKPIQFAAVAVAFAGSLFIIKPTFTNLELFPSLIGFLGGMGAGAAYTCVRKLGSNGEKNAVIVFCFSAFSCLVTLPFVIAGFVPMTGAQVLIMLFAGIFATGGQFAITAAYTFAPAREVSVFDYSQILFSAVVGFFMFSQIPDIFSLIGYVIIISVAVGMFFYNNSKASEAD